MKKVIFALIALLILAGAGVGLLRPDLLPITTREKQPDPAASTTLQPTMIPAVIESREIRADGYLVPIRHGKLSFNNNGIIDEILVEEGQQVEEGAVIARLRENEKMALSVTQAKLEVMNAEKALKDLHKDLPLIVAQAKFDLTQAQKELEEAEKKRRAMDYPKATQEKLDEAYDDYEIADKNVKAIEDYYGPDRSKEIQDLYKRAVDERTRLYGIYNWLRTAYTADEKAEQDAIVELNRLKIEKLREKIEIYSQGPDPEDVIIAEARLENAKAQLAAAEAAYEDLLLRAPFSGTIVNLDVVEGEYVTVGQPIALLADFSRWHINTEDLTELSVTRITEGAEAIVSFDALPDVTFIGKVIQIKNFGVNKQGDITYTAVIEIENSDPRLRWNMTSPIVIKTSD